MPALHSYISVSGYEFFVHTWQNEAKQVAGNYCRRPLGYQNEVHQEPGARLRAIMQEHKKSIGWPNG